MKQFVGLGRSFTAFLCVFCNKSNSFILSTVFHPDITILLERNNECVCERISVEDGCMLYEETPHNNVLGKNHSKKSTICWLGVKHQVTDLAMWCFRPAAKAAAAKPVMAVDFSDSDDGFTLDTNSLSGGRRCHSVI